jgi:hypothetical protein
VSKRQWHTPQFHVLNVDVYNTDVGVAVNMSEDAVLRRIAKLHSNTDNLASLRRDISGWDDNPANVGRMAPLAGGFVVLFRFDRRDFRKAVGTIAHEMTHVTQWLFRNRNTPLTPDTDEAYAYLTDYLVTTTLRRLY